jgi:hypothetical protein
LPCCTVCICAQTFLYSHWKKAIIDGCLSAGFLNAFLTTGGDAVTATQNLSGYFFLTNGWRVRPAEKNQSYLVEGNLFVCGCCAIEHPFVNTTGCFNTFVAINTSAQSLTTTVQVAALTPCNIATLTDAVWNEPICCHTTACTTGKLLCEASVGGSVCLTPCNINDIAAGVWDEPLTCHLTDGSTGKQLSEIDNLPTKQQISKDVWNTELPGCFEIGTAGQRLSDASDCIDALLGNIALTNWTTEEKEQIRDALGVDGDKTAASGGVLQKIKKKVDAIFIFLFT